LSKKKEKDLSIICISTIARNRDMMNLTQNCSFFLIKKKKKLVTEYQKTLAIVQNLAEKKQTFSNALAFIVISLWVSLWVKLLHKAGKETLLPA
jgi:hypothetical protein